MCNFHQVAIIRGYLTKKTKMQASKELWELTLILTHNNKESFEGGLQTWHTKWERYLNERRIDDKGQSRYVHKKLRRSYRSSKQTCHGCLHGMKILVLGYPIRPMQ